MVDLEDVRNVQCNYCQNPFDIEPAAPEDGYDEPEIDVPVECDKGKFCSEAHRAQAMYEAQDEAGRTVLRRLFLGASLIEEYHKAADKLVDDWEDDCDLETPSEILTCLSPEGGIRGKEGAEDDCDALLMPKDTRAIIWNALFDGKMAAEMAVFHAEHMNATYLGEQYKADEMARAKGKLARVEDAFAALNGCTGIL
jgi:hypothetical protein